MKEFIDKLIERLEETDLNDIQMVVREVLKKYGFPYESIVQDEVWDALDELSTNKFAIGIVNQLAEEYKVSEIPIGWIPCSIKKPDYEIYSVTKLWVTMHRKEVKHCFTRQLTWNGWQGRWEWDNGKPISDKWEVIAWKPIDIPAPYTEGE